MKFNEEWAYSQILERTEEALTFYENSEDEFKKEKIANLNRVKNNVIVLFLLSNEKCYFKNIETNGKLMPFVFIAPENTEYSINIATLKNCLGTNALDIISKNIDTEKSEITFDEVKSFYETLNKKGKVKEDNTSAAQPSKKKLKNLSKIDKEQLEEDTLSNISDIYSDLSQEKAKYPLVQKQDKQDVSDLMPVFDDDVSDEETEENNDADGKDFDVSLDSMDDFDDYFSNVKPVSNKKSKNSRKSKKKMYDEDDDVVVLKDFVKRFDKIEDEVKIEGKPSIQNTNKETEKEVVVKTDIPTNSSVTTNMIEKELLNEQPALSNVLPKEKTIDDDVPKVEDHAEIERRLSKVMSEIEEEPIDESLENDLDEDDIMKIAESVVNENEKENSDVQIDSKEEPVLQEHSIQETAVSKTLAEKENKKDDVIDYSHNNKNEENNVSNNSDIDEDDDEDDDDEITEEDIKKMLAEIKAEYEEAAAKEQEEQEAKAQEILKSLSSEKPPEVDPNMVPKSYVQTDNKDVKMWAPDESQPVKNINELLCDIYYIKAYDPVDKEKDIQERILHDITAYIFPLSIPENGNERFSELAVYISEDDKFGVFASEYDKKGSVKTSTKTLSSLIFQINWVEGNLTSTFYPGIHKEDIVEVVKEEVRPSDMSKVGFGHPYLTLKMKTSAEEEATIKCHALYIPYYKTDDTDSISLEFDKDKNIKCLFVIDNVNEKGRTLLSPKLDTYEIICRIWDTVCIINCKQDSEDMITFNLEKKILQRNVENNK